MLFTIRPPHRLNVLESQHGGALQFYQTCFDAGADGAILSQWETKPVFFGELHKEVLLRTTADELFELAAQRGKYLDLAVAKLTKYDYGCRQAYPVDGSLQLVPHFTRAFDWKCHLEPHAGAVLGRITDLPRNRLLQLTIRCEHPCTVYVMTPDGQSVISRYECRGGSNFLHIVTRDTVVQDILIFARNSAVAQTVAAPIIIAPALKPEFFVPDLGYVGASREQIRAAHQRNENIPLPGFFQCEDVNVANPEWYNRVSDVIRANVYFSHTGLRRLRIWSDEPKNWLADDNLPFESSGAAFAYAVAAVAAIANPRAVVFDGDAFAAAHNGTKVSRTCNSYSLGMANAHFTLHQLWSSHKSAQQRFLVAWHEDGRRYEQVTGSPMYRQLLELAELPLTAVIPGYYIGRQNREQFVADVQAARAKGVEISEIEILSWDMAQFGPDILSDHIRYLREQLS